MSIIKSTSPMRAFYVFAASVLWLGIWQTGFTVSSWILYIPAFTFVAAAITGYCPSFIVFSNLINKH